MSSETETFDQVLGPILSRGYALAFNMLNERTAAEDALQEAAIKAWRKLPSLRDRSAVVPWFLAIVANECRTARRSRWWSVLRFPQLPIRSRNEGSRTEERIDLDRALSRLRSEERVPLLLHFYMDMTLEEVGRVLGVSMTAARSRVYRALERLRRELGLEESAVDG